MAVLGSSTRSRVLSTHGNCTGSSASERTGSSTWFLNWLLELVAILEVELEIVLLVVIIVIPVRVLLAELGSSNGKDRISRETGAKLMIVLAMVRFGMLPNPKP